MLRSLNGKAIANEFFVSLPFLAWKPTRYPQIKINKHARKKEKVKILPVGILLMRYMYEEKPNMV